MSERMGLVIKGAFATVLSNSYGAFAVGRNGIAAILLISGTASAETLTIAALGDSLTQGYGLMQEDGFVPQLEGWLQGQGADVEVINAGVSGDTTAGGLSRVAWTLTPEVDAMIVALGGNDLLRGLPPETSRANLDGILDAADNAGVPVLLVGLQAPTNYGPEFKAAFDAIYPELAAAHDATLFPSFFEGLLSDGDVDVARAQYMQSDGIHPNPEGVKLIVQSMGPVVLTLIEAAD